MYVFLLNSVSVPVTQGDLFHRQVNVKNGGADIPSSSELTSLPGMYDEFEWPNIWSDPLDGFVVAGPKVVSFADGDSSDPSPVTSPSVSSSSVPSYSPAPSSSVSSPSVPSYSPAPSSVSSPGVPSYSPAPSSSVPSSVPPYSQGPATTPLPQPTSTPANPANTGVCKTKKGSNKRPVSAHHVHRRNTRH